MKKQTRIIPLSFIILIPLLAGAVLSCAAAHTTGESSGGKKLIEYGWDVPSAAYLKEHIREMETKPFDGIIFRPGDDAPAYAFDTNTWTPDQLAVLKGIEWGTFTDNFVMVWGSNSSGMNWFDDSQWEIIAANIEHLAAAAKDAGCRGIAFDAESYDTAPLWEYSSAVYPGKTFSDVENKVRQRGVRFMNAAQTGFPDISVFTLFMFSVIEFSASDLSATSYALYKAFLEGMLSAISGDARLIDGCEDAYYFAETDLFFDYTGSVRSEEKLAAIAADARDGYRHNTLTGRSLYIDYILNNEGKQNFPAAFCSSWWKHNVYYALATSDRYVWCYSENMNWWNGTAFAGAEDGIREARRLYDAGEALPFELCKSDADRYDTSVQADIVTEQSPFITSPCSGTFILPDQTLSVSFTVPDGSVRCALYLDALEIAESASSPFTVTLPDALSERPVLFVRSFSDSSHCTSAPVFLTHR